MGLARATEARRAVRLARVSCHRCSRRARSEQLEVEDPGFPHCGSPPSHPTPGYQFGWPRICIECGIVYCPVRYAPPSLAVAARRSQKR